MDEFFKMDVFFVVATGGVVVFVLLAIFVVWRVDRILRSVDHVVKQAAEESDALRLDFAEMRSEVRHGIGRFRALADFIDRIAKRAKK